MKNVYKNTNNYITQLILSFNVLFSKKNFLINRNNYKNI